MGGYAGGGQASLIACDEIIESIGNGLGVIESIESAHAAIINAASEGRGPELMGSTVVVLKTGTQGYVVAWVGDSRAYLWNGKLVRLSRDHSLVQSLIDSGELDADSLEAANIKNVITQCLGPANRGIPRVETVSGAWHKGEKVLLCSDGLHGEIDDAEIRRIIAGNESSGDQAIAEALVNSALQAGGKDNITTVVVSAPLDAPEQAPARSGGWPRSLLLALMAVVIVLLLSLFVIQYSGATHSGADSSNGEQQ
jgi:protein phosphatase